MAKKVDPALVERFKKEQILDLAKRSLTSVVAHFVLYVFVAVVTPLKSDHPVFLALLGVVIFLVSSIRMVMAKNIPARYDNGPRFWEQMLIGFNYVSGIIWGIFGLCMGLLYPLEWPFWFTMVINCGLAAGATSSLSPHEGLSKRFTFCMLLPIVAWGFYHGTSLSIAAAFLCAFSMFMFTRMAKENFVWFWEGVAGREKITAHTKTLERIFAGVKENAGALNQTSDDLAQSSGKMTESATQMSGRLSQVAGVAGQVNTNSHTMAGLMDQATQNFSNIASATEEMTATITGIAQSTDKTRQITAEAVAQSKAAMEQMTSLADAATAINQITESIGDISGQINLLALNATIEAARAGEAGRGFAVVATEVKELAVQTSGSASEISRQVREIQEATQHTARQMESIARIIQETNDQVSDIARAVDEQTSAATEMSRNIQQASEGFGRANQMTGENDQALARVAQDIFELEGQAKTVENGASYVNQMADALRRLARTMAAQAEPDQKA